MATPYKRILLKLSGESLKGDRPGIFDDQRLVQYAEQIKEIRDMGVQVGIVIGGGNIFRGLKGAMKGFDRVKGDQMGMLATVINSLALSSALAAQGVKARVLTAVRMEPIGEFYNKWRAIECLEAGEVVIMSAGTGNPFFTTDTGSSLRGIEIEADVMLKGTRVDGVYTADPEKDPTATKRRTPRPRSSATSPTTKSSPATSASWTSPPPACARRTTCPSSSSTWTPRAT